MSVAENELWPNSKIDGVMISYKQRMPVEKIYIHSDKPYYSAGDTLWYKSYLLSGDLDATAQSKLLYVELITDSGKVVTRQLLPVEGGISWGNISLDDKLFSEGTYRLKAYTNWMRNFGEPFLFEKQIQIYKKISQNWVANIQNKTNEGKIITQLQLTKINREPLAMHDIEVNLSNEKKIIHRNTLKTNSTGGIDLNFDIPNKHEHLTLLIKDLEQKNDLQTLRIPVVLLRPEYTDLQFMPEGGHLVNGIPGRIAFKAIGEDGRGLDVSGIIYDNRQQQVSTFKSTHEGMGSFGLQPLPGEQYIAKIMEPTGIVKTFSLPLTRITGSAIKVNNLDSIDSLTVSVLSSSDLINTAFYYLVAQSRNVICYIAKVRFKPAGVTLRIPESLFPDGIARLSLLNSEMLSLNERLVFINHHDNLNIIISPQQSSFSTRDSVSLSIDIKDANNKPVQGSFSLSVTDDGQIKADSTSNISTHLLLTGDLTGFIENPAYYFANNKIETLQDLDNLLLTQGWTGYDWKDVFSTTINKPVFAAEQQYKIQGKVTNAFNRGIAKTGVTLFSKNPLLAADTLTDASGNFLFRNINPVDTAVFFIQARNKSCKSLNVGISVDEFRPPAYFPSLSRLMPWYVNSDSADINYAKAKLFKNQEAYPREDGTKILKEVIVNSKKIIKGSHNLNGPGEADLIIDKTELEKAGKVTLGDLLKQKVEGFRVGEFPLHVNSVPVTSDIDVKAKQSYVIGTNQMRLVFDGYDVDFTFEAANRDSKTERFYYIKSFLDYFTAEDIKGIEVITSKKYNNIYNSKVLTFEEQKLFLNSSSDYTYIEITTRSGNGPFTKVTPGIYLYKPLPFSLPKQFYSPRYLVKAKTTPADFRSTIFWAPNVVSDANGKAHVSFYSSDRKGTYTIIMEGSNMNGNVGVAKTKLVIN